MTPWGHLNNKYEVFKSWNAFIANKEGFQKHFLLFLLVYYCGDDGIITEGEFDTTIKRMILTTLHHTLLCQHTHINLVHSRILK